MPMRWRDAMDRALYGPGGFFVAGAGPAGHFRTSVHASPAFARALLRVVEHVDAALGRPSRLDVVDVGAGRGELCGHWPRWFPGPRLVLARERGRRWGFPGSPPAPGGQA